MAKRKKNSKWGDESKLITVKKQISNDKIRIWNDCALIRPRKANKFLNVISVKTVWKIQYTCKVTIMVAVFCGRTSICGCANDTEYLNIQTNFLSQTYHTNYFDIFISM